MSAILLGEVDFDTVVLQNGNGNGHGNGHSQTQVIHKSASESALLPSTPNVPPVLVGTVKSNLKDELMSNYKLRCPNCDNGTLAFMEGCSIS